MRYYYSKSNNGISRTAERLAALEKGKNSFAIWSHGTRYLFDAAGNLASQDAEPVHFDALEVWPTMDDDEMKKVKTQAAARETIRNKEEKADALLARKESLTRAERFDLLALVNIAYHDSGKIEGCSSIDGCASCAFCQRMISAAADNILMICRYCYAARDAWKAIAWRTHTLNARILSEFLFSLEELQTIKITERCRFNEDGDTVNQTHAQNLLRIVFTHPGTRFGYWYKNQPAVESGLHAEGIHTREALPNNVRFIHSSALIGFPVRPTWFDDATFTVYPDAETTAAAIAAGAHECNGKRCRACGYFCYLAQRQPAPVNIAELLRCKPAERAPILAAYHARHQQQEARTA